MNISVATADALRAQGLDPGQVETLALAALAEDLGDAVDVTSVATVPADLRGTAELVPRQDGVVAGVAVAAAVLESATPGAVTVDLLVGDGRRVSAGQPLLVATGPVRTLLTAERSALNLVCHLSGVATLTAQWVAAVAGTGTVVRDTRKTTVGLRALEKHAVRCGGGSNHRMGLWDAALVKDNHVAAAGGVVEAFRAVRKAFPDLPLEVECDTVEQVRLAVEAGADLILCDNMDLESLRASVALARGRARLEASGGLALDVVRAVAETGVDFVSVGALTHSAPVLDIGFDLRSS